VNASYIIAWKKKESVENRKKRLWIAEEIERTTNEIHRTKKMEYEKTCVWEES